MIHSKKAIESYLLIVIGVSFIMSILLFFIIGVAYESDDPFCGQLSFTYEVVCKQPSGYAVNVHNTGSNPIGFEFNGEFKDSYYVASGQEKRITVVTEANKAIGIPIIFEGDISHTCISRQERTNTEVLGTC